MYNIRDTTFTIQALFKTQELRELSHIYYLQTYSFHIQAIPQQTHARTHARAHTMGQQRYCIFVFNLMRSSITKANHTV